MAKRDAADIFDRIASSNALDATAGRVTSRGTSWEPETPLPPGMMHWKAPPPTKEFVQNRLDSTDGNLTGKQFGRFTVIARLADHNAWLCKCRCGDYEARTSKAIKMVLGGLAPNEGVGYMCWYCSRWEISKKRYNKKGSKNLSNFTSPSTRIIEPKTPQEIIADKVASTNGSDFSDTATAIISELNRQGYRIVRERHHTANGIEKAPLR